MKPASFNLNFFDEKEAIKNFDNSKNHVVGYARLSFDEDGEGYCSIINQRDLLQSVYDNGFKTNNSKYTFLADDGVSGYKFDRPQLCQLLSMIESGKCNIILAKDLSRIGRHGALTQLFIEQCERIGVRVYAMDDYDSHKESDDLVLGIKTWSNERYVKDASQKVRKIIKHKQENGTWLCAVPFGYEVEDYKNPTIKVDEEAADIVRKIFDMYVSGMGVNKIAQQLTFEHVPTASVLQRNRCIANGKSYNGKFTDKWTASRVSKIIQDDFYIGVLRTGKYSRRGINGKDMRKDSNTHNVFESHHNPIVSEDIYKQAQEILSSRKAENYRNKGVEHLFHGLLYCGECGEKLYCYTRPNLATQYVCSQYFKYGNKACTRHRVKESLLIDITVEYFKFIKQNCKNVLESMSTEISSLRNSKNAIAVDNKRILEEIKNTEREIEVIEDQRIKQIINHPEREKSINSIYDNLHAKASKKIEELEKKKIELDGSAKDIEVKSKKALTVLDIVNDLIESKDITRKDIEALYEKIIIHENGYIQVIPKSYLGVLETNDFDIDDKTRNQPTEHYAIENINKVSEGDPSQTTFIKFLAIVNGLNILSQKIRKK